MTDPQNFRWNDERNVSVDLEKCIACSTCEALCPKDFRLGQSLVEGQGEMIKAAPTREADPDRAREAEIACPVDAIKVHAAGEMPAAANDPDFDAREAA